MLTKNRQREAGGEGEKSIREAGGRVKMDVRGGSEEQNGSVSLLCKIGSKSKHIYSLREAWDTVHNGLSTNKTKNIIWQQIHLNFYTQYSYTKWYKKQDIVK